MKAKRRIPTKRNLLARLQRTQLREAAAKYAVGDPVRARLFINTGEQGAPVIVAHPGDPGIVVAVRPPGHEDVGLLAVRFGDEVVDLTPREIEPDWEEV